MFNKNGWNFIIEDVHGNPTEMNRGAYWLKNAGKDTNRARFYFGYINNGYLLTKYISKDTPAPKTFFDPLRLGLEAQDEAIEDIEKHISAHNTINGNSFDYCGLKKVSIISENKTVRWAFNQIYKKPEKTESWPG